MEPIDPKKGGKAILAEVGQVGLLPLEGGIEEEMAGISTTIRIAVWLEADRQGRTIDPPSRIDIQAMPTSVAGVILLMTRGRPHRTAAICNGT